MTGNINIISYTNLRESSDGSTATCSRTKHDKSSSEKRVRKPSGKRAYRSCQLGSIKMPAFLERPFKHEMTVLSRRLDYTKRNLLRDFFMGQAFVYPFKGLFELLAHNVYWGPLLIFASCYISVFLVVAVIYYIAIIPLVIAWAVISLGPLGILLGHIQWLLQTNAITTMICRNIVLSHLDNQIFDVTLYLNGQKEFLRRAKFIKALEKQPSTRSAFDYWQMTFPLLVVHLIRKVLIVAILALLSLIPIFGPPIANQVLSGRRGFSYMARYFALKGQSAAEAKDYQYEHLGLFFSFGMAAGILEFLPLFSIITITSNTIGAAKWSVDLIKKSQDY